MKIMVYEVRPDEQADLEQQAALHGVELAVTDAVPTLENAALAAGGAGGEIPSPDHRVQPQSRAAHQNGQLPPGEDVIHHCNGLPGIPGGGPLLRRVRHGDHMVGHAVHLRRRGGGGADSHPPVDLHGVGGDHLAAELLCQQDAQGGFPAGRGSHHADDLRRHGLPPSP